MHPSTSPSEPVTVLTLRPAAIKVIQSRAADSASDQVANIAQQAALHDVSAATKDKFKHPIQPGPSAIDVQQQTCLDATKVGGRLPTAGLTGTPSETVNADSNDATLQAKKVEQQNILDQPNDLSCSAGQCKDSSADIRGSRQH